MLLEGLARLARLQGAEETALRALVVCAAQSAASWDAVIAARIPVHFPPFQHLVANALSASDGDGTLRAKMMQVSADAVWPTYGRPVTPLAVAVRAMAEKGTAADAELLKQLTQSAFKNLGNTDLLHAVKVFPQMKTGAENDVGEKYLPCLRQLVARPDSSGMQICSILNTLRPEEVAVLSVREEPGPVGESNAANGNPSASDDAQNADCECLYRAAHAARLQGSLQEMTVKANEVRKKGRLDLFATIYVAFPKVFVRDTLSSSELLSALDNLPRWFRGPVDDTIDLALRSIMSTVPGLSQVYSGVLALQSRLDAEMSLKRACLAHPGLVYRRIDDVCAMAFVLMEGLPNPSDRYNENSLAVLQFLLTAIAGVQKTTKKRSEEVLSVALAGMHLVLDEGRGQNGIPVQFLKITSCVLTLLEMCPWESKERGAGKFFLKAIGASGTCVEIRRIISLFLSKLGVQLPSMVALSSTVSDFS